MIQFRKAVQEDLRQIAELEQSIFSDAWTIGSIEETFSQKQALLTVAEKDGAIVGYGILYCVLDEAEIARIAVAESDRRLGVGKALLDYTCNCCKEQGVSRMLLDVRESNQAARAFYEKYGFTQDGIRKRFYCQPEEDAVLMSKELP